MNRRAFAKQLLAVPAVFSTVSSSAFAAVSSALASAAGAEIADPGLDEATRQLLRDEFFIDAAGCDRFYRYPDETRLVFDPDRILPIIGGAVLGIAHLTPEPLIATHDPRVLGKPGEVTHRSALSGPGCVEQILREFECVRRTVGAHADKVGVAESAEEMRALRKAGKLGYVLGLDTGNETGGDPLVLGELFRLGLRKMALAHEAPTPFSASDTSEPRMTPGLNALGREMIGECNRLGIMVDVSHSSDPTFWSVMKCATRPVIATHSGARARTNVRRNLSDEMLGALAKSGGMVGIGAYTTFAGYERLIASGYYRHVAAISRWMFQRYPDEQELAAATRSPAKMKEAQKAVGLPNGIPGEELLPSLLVEPENTLVHLDYVANLIGFDHVGIGTDLATNSAEYPGMIRGIAAGMLKRNFSQDNIRKIFSGNLLRVFRQNEPAAAPL